MSVLNAVQIVESFWPDVWVARNPEAIDRYVVDDFVITSAGESFDQETPSRNGYASFKRGSLVLSSKLSRAFQNTEGIRVARGGAFAAAIAASLDFLPISGL